MSPLTCFERVSGANTAVLGGGRGWPEGPGAHDKRLVGMAV